MVWLGMAWHDMANKYVFLAEELISDISKSKSTNINSCELVIVSYIPYISMEM